LIYHEITEILAIFFLCGVVLDESGELTSASGSFVLGALEAIDFESWKKF
jgi:hypothetical protein